MAHGGISQIFIFVVLYYLAKPHHLRGFNIFRGLYKQAQHSHPGAGLTIK
jgi:hypothetical protein